MAKIMPVFSGSALLIGAAVSAGTAAYGDYTSAQGAQEANAANEQMNQENIDAAMTRQEQSEQFNMGAAQQQQQFAAGQQANAQQFSAQQIAQQEQFQQGQLNQVEAYDTDMSDTAMQRRVADLKAAGINPLLAVSQGGASTPTVSGMSGGAAYGTPVSGASASSSPAGQGSGIPMQNTSAVMGNLGGQVSNALALSQTGAQIDLLKAQTEKTQAEAGTEIPSQVQYLQSMTGLNQQNTQIASMGAQKIAEQLKYDLGDGGNIALDWTKNWATTGAAATNTQILGATKDALISASQSEATARALGLQSLQNLNNVQQGNFGKIIAYLNAILTPASTAAHAAGALQ